MMTADNKISKLARTDQHRPSTIIPANYSYVLSYSMPTSDGGWPVPAFNVNCGDGQHAEGKRCCVVALRNLAVVTFAPTGWAGNCSICGASFVYGDIWRHEPTGEHIHIGHTCADKYEMMSDRSAYEMGRGRVVAAAAREIAKTRNTEERESFLNAHSGLREALTTEHPIVKDIASRFQTFRTLSDKQVGLVFKLSEEANKPAEEKEHNVPAPITGGRQTFRGVVVAAKSQESNYGVAYKMTVKVHTTAGVWLAWGTVPAAMLDAAIVRATGNQSGLSVLRGAEVEITASLKPGRDTFFALMGRPTGRILAWAEAVEL